VSRPKSEYADKIGLPRARQEREKKTETEKTGIGAGETPVIDKHQLLLLCRIMRDATLSGNPLKTQASLQLYIVFG
jgi:hypothetical protein